MRQHETDFDQQVRLKYQVYNSLFLTLPFDLIHQTGTLLPLLHTHCREGYAQGRSPEEILEGFFSEYLGALPDAERTDVLFNFIQYIERQVVLFDAVEEAAFPVLHDRTGTGTLTEFLRQVDRQQAQSALSDRLRTYQLRIVLTAHPTQFYPGPVLGIITDLAGAIRDNDVLQIKTLLLQLGKTPFINREKPTPLDEARSLIWYLRNVFYQAIPRVVDKVRHHFQGQEQSMPPHAPVVLGFWPGGDRDGNPFVTPDTTLETMELLHQAIVGCYHSDVRELRRRLTFKGVQERITRIEYRLYDQLQGRPDGYAQVSELVDEIDEILELLNRRHDGLFADLVESFRTRILLFGFHFATLDIRQDSRKHEALVREVLTRQGLDKQFDPLDEAGRIEMLQDLDIRLQPEDTQDPTFRDIIGSIQAQQTLQARYGQDACHRYIISNTRHALDVVMLQTIIRWVAGNTRHVDIVPLFESIDSLRHSAAIMERLYVQSHYADQLRARAGRQTIMLGFSDGTKDGGYLQANWSIFRSKEELSALARRYGVHVIFFDGRGGPPARGGGNTHKFYSSLGSTIDCHEVQLTIQGQTISSNFGSTDTACFNLEQLFTAGLESVLARDNNTLSPEEHALLSDLAETGYAKYGELKHRPEFLSYLEEVGTLTYYGETNIGSRPVRRGGKSALTLDDLRAIPFVSSWSQLKQNVPGYYGFGAAVEAQQAAGRGEAVRRLYARSRFFQTLVGNSMQALSKSFFPLTAYLKTDPELGTLWISLQEEYDRSVHHLLGLTGQQEMLDDAPVSRQSIRMREDIILPVLTIQQAAIQQLRRGDLTPEATETYQRLVLRTMYGIVNASRNSA